MIYSWLAYLVLTAGGTDRQTAAIVVLMAIVELACESMLCLLLALRRRQAVELRIRFLRADQVSDRILRRAARREAARQAMDGRTAAFSEDEYMLREGRF